jgi:hypothetical protein
MGLMFATAQAVSAKRTKPVAALRHMGRRLGPALALVALGAAVAVIVIVIAGMLVAFAAAAGPGAVIGLIFLLGLVVGVPATWVVTRLLFAPCAIAVESLGPFQAIARSWQLTTGLFWRTLGITILVNVIVGMASGTVAQVFSFAAMLFALSSEQTWLVLAMTAMSTIVSVTLTLPLTSAATTLLYVDARVRREGFDITLSEAMYG